MTSELKYIIDVQNNDNQGRDEERKYDNSDNQNRKREMSFKRQGNLVIFLLFN